MADNPQFPIPGSVEFTEKFGLHLHGLWKQLAKDHTATQTEEHVAIAMLNSMNIPGKGKGTGLCVLGNSHNVAKLAASLLQTLVRGDLIARGEAVTPSSFTAKLVEMSSDIAFQALKIQAGSEAGSREEYLDESRYNIDGKVNPLND